MNETGNGRISGIWIEMGKAEGKAKGKVKEMGNGKEKLNET